MPRKPKTYEQGFEDGVTVTLTLTIVAAVLCAIAFFVGTSI